GCPWWHCLPAGSGILRTAPAVRRGWNGDLRHRPQSVSYGLSCLSSLIFDLNGSWCFMTFNGDKLKRRNAKQVFASADNGFKQTCHGGGAWPDMESAGELASSMFGPSRVTILAACLLRAIWC